MSTVVSNSNNISEDTLKIKSLCISLASGWINIIHGDKVIAFIICASVREKLTLLYANNIGADQTVGTFLTRFLEIIMSACCPRNVNILVSLHDHTEQIGLSCLKS